MPVAPVVNPAYGSQLRHGVSGTYTAVAQILNFDGPSSEIGTRDTTVLDSVAETSDVTLFKGGEVSGQAMYDPQCDSHQVMETLMTPDGAVLTQWQVKFGDKTNGGTAGVGGTRKTFMGILTKWAPTGIKREENLLVDFSIKVSGAITTDKGA